MQHGIIIRVRMCPCFLSSSGTRVGYMRIRYTWAREILHTPKPCSAARNWSICTDDSFIVRLISSYEFYFFLFFLSLPVLQFSVPSVSSMLLRPLSMAFLNLRPMIFWQYWPQYIEVSNCINAITNLSDLRQFSGYLRMANYNAFK